MNADQLLAHYEQIADAPDAIARLRRFILDLAVRGKLVEQNPADEPAAELLKRITAEKARLVKAKEIRKPKELPAVDPEHWPFSLPNGWAWVRIDELSPRSLTDGDWIETKDQSEDGGIRLIQLADVGESSFLNKSSRFITAETEVRLNCTRLAVGDVLIARLPNPIGRSCMFPDIGQPAITAVDVAILRPDENISADYVVIAINAPPTRDQIEAYGKGATRFRVSTGHLKTVLIALPPLAEQRRIVAYVDELMALCDRLEAARAERETTRDRLAAASLVRLNVPNPDAAAFQNHAAFALDNLAPLTERPDQIKALRQTILNLAVRGKLVEQDPADEPLALPKHEEENSSETSPIGWQNPPLRLLLSENTRNGYSRRPDDAEDGAPILRISAGTIRQDGIVAEEEHKLISGIDEATRQKYGLQVGDLLACRFNGNKAFVGRLTLFSDYLSLNPIYPDKLIRVRLKNNQALPAFIRLAGESDLVRVRIENVCATTVGNWGISATNLKEVFFPLPPLAEQHRIVAKVDELMALCDRLEASLAAADTTRQRLLEALLHEALAPVADQAMEAAE